MDDKTFLAHLAAFLAQAAGAPVSIHHVAPLAGGASRDMWLLDAQIGSETGKYVLRRDPPTQMNEAALTRAQEFAAMTAAHQAGIRLARPRWTCEDITVLGSAFFIMDYVEGIAIGRKVVTLPELAQARAALPDQMAAMLARIHALPASDFPFLPRPPAGQSPAAHALAECYPILNSLNVHNPAIEYALRWAERNLPDPNPPLFLHGDFRIGNILVNEQGLAAVADWEFCHIGDPDEELGYPCMRDWRFGNGALRFGGIADRETFLRAYERYSGRRVSRESVDFWELIGNIRWAVICLAQADRHLSGREPSVELASLGRRSAEMQLESLNLIRHLHSKRQRA